MSLPVRTSYLMSGPKMEPVTVAEARSFCGTTAENDAYLGALIPAARMDVEGKLKRALITQGWQLVFNEWPDDLDVKLPMAPVSAVRARIYLFDGTRRPYVPAWVFGDEGIVRLPRLKRAPLLRKAHAIEIDYLTGYGARPHQVPEKLRQAVLLMVAHMFHNPSRHRPDLDGDFTDIISEFRRAA